MSSTKFFGRDRKLLIGIVLALMAVYYIAFMIFPVIYAFIGSFSQWNPMLGSLKLNGLQNYKRAFTSPIFRTALGNTLWFSFIVVMLRTVLGIVLAALIYNAGRWKGLFQTIYFIPVVTSMVAVSLIWKWMYDPSMGVFNAVLNRLGLPDQDWLKDADMALYCIMGMTLWKDTGFAIVLYIAGLTGIPKHLYESARIDGANAITAFRHVTVPLLQSTTVIVLITGIISYLQTFTQVFMMHEPGGTAGKATYTLVYYLYEEGFTKYNFGYASVITFILFFLTFLLSMVQLRIMRKDWSY